MEPLLLTREMRVFEGEAFNCICGGFAAHTQTCWAFQKGYIKRNSKRFDHIEDAEFKDL